MNACPIFLLGQILDLSGIELEWKRNEMSFYLPFGLLCLMNQSMGKGFFFSPLSSFISHSIVINSFQILAIMYIFIFILSSFSVVIMCAYTWAYFFCEKLGGSMMRHLWKFLHYFFNAFMLWLMLSQKVEGIGQNSTKQDIMSFYT